MALAAACGGESTTGAEASTISAATEMSASTDSASGLASPTTTAISGSTSSTSEVDMTTGEPLVCLMPAGPDTSGEPGSWTYSYGIPSAIVRPNQIVVARDGSITTALEFRGEIDLGAGVVDTHGEGYRFLTRYSAAGELVWSSHIATNLDIRSMAMAVDCAGNVIVGGGFAGVLDIQGKILTAVPGEEVSGDIIFRTEDIFLVKFGPDGTRRWARRFGDDRGQRLHSVGVQADGTIIVGGASNGTLELDGSSDVGPDGEPTAYVGLLAAFDPDGVLVWKQHYASTYDVALLDLVVAADDRIFAYGHAGGDTDFGGDPVVFTDDPTFIARFEPDGAHAWSARFFDKLHEPEAIGADTAGGVAVSGRFGSHAFVARYDQNGQLAWNRDLILQSDVDLGGLSIESLIVDDEVLIGGGLRQGSVDFGGGALMTSPERQHPFLARYDLAGAHLASTLYEGATYAWFISGDRGPDGALAFVGGFRDTLDLGDGPRVSVGLTDFFIYRSKP